MGGWTGEGKDTIIWDGDIRAKNFIGDGSQLTSVLHSFTETDPVFSAWLAASPLTPYWKRDGTSTALGNWNIGAYGLTSSQLDLSSGDYLNWDSGAGSITTYFDGFGSFELQLFGASGLRIADYNQNIYLAPLGTSDNNQRYLLFNDNVFFGWSVDQFYTPYPFAIAGNNDLRMLGNGRVNFNSGQAFLRGISSSVLNFSGVNTASDPILRFDSGNDGDIQWMEDEKRFDFTSGSTEFQMALATGIFTHSSGTIDFSSNNLKTTGTISNIADNSKHVFGAAGSTDSYIQYTGSELQVSAVGGVDFFDDLFFTGDGSGLPYGNMYLAGDASITVSASETWYEIDVNTPDFTSGELNLVTFTDHYLTVAKAGRYLINAQAALSTGVALQEVGINIMINGTAASKDHGHTTVFAANHSSSVPYNTILDLAANDQVSLAVINHTLASDILVEHAQLSISMVGGT